MVLSLNIVHGKTLSLNFIHGKSLHIRQKLEDTCSGAQQSCATDVKLDTNGVYKNTLNGHSSMLGMMI